MKTIVLTGVSRGLGRAMLKGFGESGCRVIGTARTESAISELKAEFGDQHDFRAVDVSGDAAVADWAAESIASFGPPDFVINNAAVINRNESLWEIPATEFDKLTAVNINGTANVIRHFVPAMVAQAAGVIVNFSSGWGRSASAKVAPYCASKWAIEGLTQALAEELPAGMAAVPLNPGVINTDMLQSCFGNGADSYPTADEWAKSAIPFILNLNAQDNGRPLTVPGH